MRSLRRGGGMTETFLREVLLIVGVISALFGFHRLYIRPSVERTARTDERLRALEQWRGDHASQDNAVLEQLGGISEDLHSIDKRLAVLEERSKKWGNN